jgi:type IV pilus assembly protein PilM
MLTAFPPPQFLDIPSAGIDISDSSVKVVVLTRKRSGFIPTVIDERSLPEGNIVGGTIENPDTVVQILKELKKAHDLHFVRVGLPEEKAYLFETKVPFTADRTALSNTIEFQLEENVPIAPSEAVFDYDVISKDTNGDAEVSVTVFQRSIVTAYQDIFITAGLVVLSLELEGQAMANSLIPEGDSHTYMIVDFGKTRSGIAIVQNGIVGFTSTVDVGGDELVKAITKRFGVSTEEAMVMKDEKGLVYTDGNKELHDTLMTTIAALRDEINRHCVFWNSKVREKAIEREAISKIILCGGNASLPGLPGGLSSGLTAPGEIGNVWTNTFSLDEVIPSVDYRHSLGYATAIGLALR